MSDFWAMGGYAFYVWTSYGLAFAVMSWGAVKPLVQHKQILRELKLKRLRNQRSNAG